MTLYFLIDDKNYIKRNMSLELIKKIILLFLLEIFLLIITIYIIELGVFLKFITKNIYHFKYFLLILKQIQTVYICIT